MTKEQRQTLRAKRRRVRRIRSAQSRWAFVAGAVVLAVTAVLCCASWLWVTRNDLRSWHLRASALEARLERLRPAIELELGHPLPDMRVHSTSNFEFLGKGMGISQEALEDAVEAGIPRRWLMLLSVDTLGCVPLDGERAGEIVINRGALLLWAERYPGDDLAFLDSVLVHEATHVFQYRGGHLRPCPGDDPHDAMLSRRAVSEGHAEHLAASVLRRLGKQPATWSSPWWRQNADLIRAQTRDGVLRVAIDEHRLVYVEGEAFVAEVSQRLGDEAARELLFEHPPETRYELRDVDLYLQRVQAK